MISRSLNIQQPVAIMILCYLRSIQIEANMESNYWHKQKIESSCESNDLEQMERIYQYFEFRVHRHEILTLHFEWIYVTLSTMLSAKLRENAFLAAFTIIFSAEHESLMAF